MPNVAFFTVKETAAKLRKITEVAQDYLRKKELLIILVSDQTALEFVDELLWRLPEEGFLPHPTTLLQIDTQAREAAAIFNLRALPYLEKPYVHTIFEFEDYTSTEKLQLSKQRYASYRDAHYAIVV